MATRTLDGQAVPREDGMDRPRYVREHLGAVVDAVASGVPVTRLLPLVAHGQLRVGHLRAPLRPLRGGPQRPRAPCASWTPTPWATTRRASSPGSWPACGPGTARCWADRPDAFAAVSPPGRRPACRGLRRSFELLLVPAAVAHDEHHDHDEDEPEDDVGRDAGRLLHALARRSSRAGRRGRPSRGRRRRWPRGRSGSAWRTGRPGPGPRRAGRRRSGRRRPRRGPGG